MGIYRFVLAAVLVLFHFGGLSRAAGRMAVFAFDCDGGFLIAQSAVDDTARIDRERLRIVE